MTFPFFAHHTVSGVGSFLPPNLVCESHLKTDHTYSFLRNPPPPFYPLSRSSSSLFSSKIAKLSRY